LTVIFGGPHLLSQISFIGAYVKYSAVPKLSPHSFAHLLLVKRWNVPKDENLFTSRESEEALLSVF
jgi:hypothetical protein